MLQAASNVAPRGVYVCGNTTTTSGLTVTLTKDGSSGDYSLEAGALVLGDQGGSHHRKLVNYYITHSFNNQSLSTHVLQYDRYNCNDNNDNDSYIYIAVFVIPGDAQGTYKVLILP